MADFDGFQGRQSSAQVCCSGRTAEQHASAAIVPQPIVGTVKLDPMGDLAAQIRDTAENTVFRSTSVADGTLAVDRLVAP